MKDLLIYGALIAICILGIGFYMNYQELDKLGSLNSSLKAEVAELKKAVGEIAENRANIGKDLEREVTSIAEKGLSSWTSKIASKLSSDRNFAKQIGVRLVEDHSEKLRPKSPNPAEVAKYISLDDGFAFLVAREIDIMKAR